MPPPPAVTAETLRQHAGFVRALARSLLADEHLAEDVVQETWIRWMQRPPEDGAGVRGWLRTVVRNLAINADRGRRHRRAREEASARPEAAPPVEGALEQAEVLQSVANAVLTLDEPYRTTVLLRYFRGLEPAAIARETDTNVATVKSRLRRALARLRERLDRSHGRGAWARGLVALVGPAGGGALVPGLPAAVKVLAGAAGALLVGGLAWRALERDAAVPAAPPAVGSAAGAAEVAAVAPDGAASPPAERAAVPATAASGELVVTGRVERVAYDELDLAGGPAAGVDVTVVLDVDPRWPFGDGGRVTVSTDGDGRYEARFDDPGERPVRLAASVAETDDWRAESRQAGLAEPDEGAAELDLRVPAHGVLAGRVTTPDGGPVEGAVVTVGDERAETGPDGAFRFAPSRGARDPVVHAPGRVLLERTWPLPLDDGGWSPLDFVLSPRAALHVRVADRAGRPIAGVDVRARLDTAELAALDQPADAGHASRRAETGADGTARFDDLWADRRLAVELSSESLSWRATAMADGRLLVAADAGGAAPIVLRPGERLELGATFGVRVTLAGLVASESGEPVPDADVEVTDLGRDPWLGNRRVARVQAGADGRFAVALAAVDVAGPLRVTALDRREAEPGSVLRGLGYVGVPTGRPVAGGAATVDPRAPDDDGRVAADVVVRPLLGLSGVVVDAEGNAPPAHAARARAWLSPSATGFLYGESELGRVKVSYDRSRGTFEAWGLPGGDYDLWVSREIESFYTFALSLHRFRDLPAGEHDLRLELPPWRDARVRIRTTGGEPAALGVMHARLFPRRELPARPTPGVVRVSSVAGWPTWSTYGFGGISGHSEARGDWSVGHYTTDEVASHELPALGPGWYVIGLRPAGPGGTRAWMPMATEPLWIDGGEHELVFELRPTGTLRARLFEGAVGEPLAVALVDADGARVPLESTTGFARPVSVLPVSATGAFVLRNAPAGELRLEIGTPAELDAGRPRRVRTVTIEPGMETVLDEPL